MSRVCCFALVACLAVDWATCASAAAASSSSATGAGAISGATVSAEGHVEFVGCSPDQREKLLHAWELARAWSLQAAVAMEDGAAMAPVTKEVFERWFSGEADADTVAIVTHYFQGIFAKLNDQLEFVCESECKGSEKASVDQKVHGYQQIRFCPYFFDDSKLPAEPSRLPADADPDTYNGGNYESRAGTLVHEVSHLMGTLDQDVGSSRIPSLRAMRKYKSCLASDTRKTAEVRRENADTYKFFATDLYFRGEKREVDAETENRVMLAGLQPSAKRINIMEDDGPYGTRRSAINLPEEIARMEKRARAIKQSVFPIVGFSAADPSEDAAPGAGAGTEADAEGHLTDNQQAPLLGQQSGNKRLNPEAKRWCLQTLNKCKDMKNENQKAQALCMKAGLSAHLSCRRMIPEEDMTCKDFKKLPAKEKAKSDDQFCNVRSKEL